MKILLAAQSFNRGGRTKRVSDLAEGLVERGHQVSLMSFTDVPDWTKNKFPILKSTKVISRSGPFWQTRNAIKHLLQENDIQLIHAHCEASFVHCGMARLGTPIPIVGTYHRSNLDYFKPNLKLKLIAKLLSHCVAISNDRLQLMHKNLGIPSDKITLIHGGIKLNGKPHCLTRSEARKSLNLNEEDNILVSMGHLGKIKGHDYSIRALSLLIEKYPNTHLYIGGDGPQRDIERLTQLIESLGMQSYVTLLGEVKSPLDWIAASNAFLQPSIEEGFGLVFVEAGACRVPTVATKVGGIKDIIISGETGLLVPPADEQAIAEALSNLLSDKNIAEQMGANAYRRITEHFTIDQMVEKYCTIFNRLITS
ncbi:glycosyltransferase family 4 protein [Teredinibacter sp. KSP-S5-2]|uniref:glycosyltransferase family 4 protein n=1 Tax=Teredinibacter sp. KSP-S5-2 TaxID=3034506 RepID=UPI0029348914|nr:glycosyltransferase family 4 protein [Teredinibacter sp. KSP-S5-2]WNO09041.1 glycosyltransferase family 4 protein [Teredinibacter sp. KSP-S5-2]